DHDTRTIISNGFTDANGQFFVPQIMEGYYDLELSAPKHTSDRGTYLFLAGITNEARSFLSRETLRYTWTVVPTEIQDRYRIVIQTEFETVVPIPVVTVEPSVIDLANFPIGDTQVDLKVCNHGLIAAQDFRLDFDQHPCFIFRPLVNRLDAIAAMSCVEIPPTIRRVPGCTNTPPPDPNDPNNPPGGGGNSGSSSGPCLAYGRTTHIFPCESR